jgi:hypothetical protein
MGRISRSGGLWSQRQRLHTDKILQVDSVDPLVAQQKSHKQLVSIRLQEQTVRGVLRRAMGKKQMNKLDGISDKQLEKLVEDRHKLQQILGLTRKQTHGAYCAIQNLKRRQANTK